MKDLYVLTADADAKAAMTSVLNRYQALQIRPISFDVDRHTGHDPGMVKDGPEFVRMKKGQYRKVLLMWDYHGSGRESRRPPEPPDISEENIQNRLDGVTWKDCSGTVVIVPELEEWLWYNEVSICNRFGIDQAKLRSWVEEFAKKQNTAVDSIKSKQPKELFEYICLEKLGRTISPGDFEEIAQEASLEDWQNSQSFKNIVDLLQNWFPPNLTRIIREGPIWIPGS